MFNLEEGPLLRCKLVKLAPQAHMLLMEVHELLTKFLRPTSGKILFNGIDITGEAPAHIARRGIIRAVNRHLWNPQRGYYTDSLHADGTQSPVSSQLTNAMVALHGIGSAAWSRRLALDLADGKRASS